MAISALFPGEMRSLRGFAWRIRSPWAANGLVPPRRLSDAPKINGTSALAEGKGTDSTVCKSEIGLPRRGWPRTPWRASSRSERNPTFGRRTSNSPAEDVAAFSPKRIVSRGSLSALPVKPWAGVLAESASPIFPDRSQR